MRLHLESLDLLGHADRTAETPTIDAEAEVQRKFVSGLTKVWTHICLVIEPVSQIHMSDTTAKDA